jgi:hypothetical protein
MTQRKYGQIRERILACLRSSEFRQETANYLASLFKGQGYWQAHKALNRMIQNGDVEPSSESVGGVPLYRIKDKPRRIEKSI